MGQTALVVDLAKSYNLVCRSPLFFFKPVLAGKTEEQKIEHVGEQLVKPIVK